MPKQRRRIREIKKVTVEQYYQLLHDLTWTLRGVMQYKQLFSKKERQERLVLRRMCTERRDYIQTACELHQVYPPDGLLFNKIPPVQATLISLLDDPPDWCTSSDTALLSAQALQREWYVRGFLTESGQPGPVYG